MKKRFLFTVFFVLTLNSFVAGEKIRDYSDVTAFLKNLNSSFIVSEIDTVKYKDVKYPVYKITYNQLKDKKGKKYLTELLLSDLSDNPSVLMNEINIRLSAISHLSREDKEIFLQNAIRALDLQTVSIEKMLNDKYINYDENQTAVMKQSQKQIAEYMAFLKAFKV